MRHVRVCAFLVALVALAGCRVDASVDIALDGHGHGTVATTVTLDASALARIGGFDAARTQVRLDDMRAAGWNVGPWTRTASGGASITLAHEFTGPDDLTRVLGELSGPQGILRDPRLTHGHGWFSSQDSMSVVVDLRAPSAGVASDADLAARLKLAGVDPAALDANLTAELRRSFHLKVTLHLPSGQTRTVDVVNGKVATIAVSHSENDTSHVIAVAAAGVLVLFAAFLLVAAGRSAKRARRRRSPPGLQPLVEPVGEPVE